MSGWSDEWKDGGRNGQTENAQPVYVASMCADHATGPVRIAPVLSGPTNQLVRKR